MSEVLRINATGQAFTSGSDPFFCERGALTHSANATCLIYDGNAQSQKLVAALGCLANSSDQQIINYNFKNGIYAVMTATGAGFGVGILSQK